MGWNKMSRFSSGPRLYVLKSCYVTYNTHGDSYSKPKPHRDRGKMIMMA